MTEQGPEPKKFLANETINGIEIDCRWSVKFDSYVLSFPMIEATQIKDSDMGIFNLTFRIADNPADAQKTFELIKGLAQLKNDLLKTYLEFLERSGSVVQ